MTSPTSPDAQPPSHNAPTQDGPASPASPDQAGSPMQLSQLNPTGTDLEGIPSLDDIQADDGPVTQQNLDLDPLAKEDGLWPGFSPSIGHVGSLHGRGKPTLFFQASSPPPTNPDRSPPNPANSTEAAKEASMRSPVPFASRARVGLSEAPLTPDGSPKSPSSEQPEPRNRILRYPPTASPPRASCDKFLWMGKHAEDHIDEEVVRNGYSEKAQVTNETSSAKAALFPHFKNKSTLQNLSAFFVVLLKQRQEHGRVNATSTFKPPPRVTLTDAKREQWLRDLANASVPLRRLSRTIPHGIRGPSLLDQCLKKRVPISRAIWLAKCVGTNEMRAFRRKGISGALVVGNESKWVREWTGFVEDFVQKAIDDCDDTDWKEKMNYVIQLSARLHFHRLLDLDHFTCWILNFLDKCPVDRLPAAFLLVRIFWQDILSSGIRGSRLATSMLGHLNELSNHIDADLFLPITLRFRRFIKLLAAESPDCLLISKKWKEHRSLVIAIRDETEGAVLWNLTDVIRRNDRLTQTVIGKSKLRVSTSPLDDVLTSMDSLSAPYDLDELFEAFASKSGDFQSFLTIILRWASSMYRNDPCRVYAAVSFIQKWRTRGLDTDNAIFAALGQLRDFHGVKAANISSVIFHLARRDQFNAGAYLQWLISVGALAKRNITQRDTPCDIQPLVDIPLTNLPRNVINLRRTLLRSVGKYVETDKGISEQAIATISKLVPEVIQQPSDDAESSMISIPVSLPKLNMTVASEISVWIMQETNLKMKAGQDSENNELPTINTYQTFAKLRKIFESFQDFPSLAELCQVMAKSVDIDLLIGLQDTFLHYAKIFSALGVANTLFATIVDAYRTFRLKRPPLKDLVVRFIDLFDHLSLDKQLLVQFQRELVMCEQKPSLSACSPVSEGMIEDARDSGADFADEIDRLLASGTSMDNQTFTTVFDMIAKHFRLAKYCDQERTAGLASSMCRLKTFDEDLFAKCIHGWISEIILDGKNQTFEHSASVLVGAGCLPISNIFQIFDRHFGQGENQDPDDSGTVSSRLLEFLIATSPKDSSYDTREGYRFKLERERYFAQHPQQTLRLVLKTLRQPSSHLGPSSSTVLEAVLSCTPILDAIRGLVRSDQHAFYKELNDELDHDSINGIANIVPLADNLVDPSDNLGISRLSPDAKVDKLFSIVDTLSLPYCQASLWGTVNTMKKTASGPEVTTALLTTIRTSISRKCQFWPQLLSILSSNTLQPLREYAEEQVLQISESVLSSTPESPKSEPFINLKHGLAIVSATAASIPDTGVPKVSVALSTQLRIMVQRISQAAQQAETSSDIPAELITLDLLANALLQLLVIHSASFNNVKTASSDIAALLSTLSQLLLADMPRSLHLKPVMTASTHQLIFDTISYFTSDLPENIHAQLLRDLAPISSDSRIRFLFGFSANPDAWLSLSQPAAPPSAQPAKTPTGSPSPAAAAAATPPPPPPPPMSSVKYAPFPLRRWELFSDSAPNPGENDTALSLRLFDARKVI